jgi:hypothetical protein
MTGMNGSGDIGGEVSGDEAAWRDLVARFDSPADPPVDEAPWPARESLPDGMATTIDPVTTQDLPGPVTAQDLPGPVNAQDPPGPVTAQDPPGPLSAHDLPGPLDPGLLRPFDRDRARIIRPAADPRSYTPAEEEDEPYVPAPLPPPAGLDPIAKAAWVGVVAGPGYLLVASLIMHWTISAVDAFVAVAAFIGGFVTLIVKLGDHPRDDDDDGAVL